MKPKRMFWGAAFITIGVLFLIKNISGFEKWGSELYRLWPLIIILIGVVYLIKNDNVKSVIALANGIVVGLVVFSLGWLPFHWTSCNKHHYKSSEMNHFTRPNNAAIKIFKLNIDGGAGEFNLCADTSALIDAAYANGKDKFNVDYQSTDSTATCSIGMKNVKIHFGDNEDNFNQLDVKLNPAPEYDVDIDLGAASSNLDFSQLALSKLGLDMGASSLKLKLGAPRTNTTNVRIDIGASSVHILAPKGIGVEFNGDMALSSKNFTDMSEVRDGVYQSQNFSSAEKKIYIRLDGGVSSISIDWY